MLAAGRTPKSGIVSKVTTPAAHTRKVAVVREIVSGKITYKVRPTTKK